MLTSSGNKTINRPLLNSCISLRHLVSKLSQNISSCARIYCIYCKYCMFVLMGIVLARKNEWGQITCIIKRNEKNNRFSKMNEEFEIVWTYLKKLSFFTERTIFWNKLFKKDSSSANCYLFVQTQCAAVRMCFLVTNNKMIKKIIILAIRFNQL